MLKRILLLAFVLTLTSCATQGPSRDIASVGLGSDGLVREQFLILKTLTLLVKIYSLKTLKKSKSIFATLGFLRSHL